MSRHIYCSNAVFILGFKNQGGIFTEKNPPPNKRGLSKIGGNPPIPLSRINTDIVL